MEGQPKLPLDVHEDPTQFVLDLHNGYGDAALIEDQPMGRTPLDDLRDEVEGDAQISDHYAIRRKI